MRVLKSEFLSVTFIGFVRWAENWKTKYRIVYATKKIVIACGVVFHKLHHLCPDRAIREREQKSEAYLI